MTAPKTEGGSEAGHGSSASSWAIGVAFLIIFMAGPADSTVKLAVAAGFITYLVKSSSSH